MSRQTVFGARPRQQVLSGAAVVVLVVVVALVVATRRSGGDPAKGSSSYCLVLQTPDKTAAQIRAAIAGKPVTAGLDLGALRSAAPTLYSDKVVEGAPDGLGADAERAVVAFRSAVANGRVAPLDASPVEASLDRLAAKGATACDGVLGS